ncbi:MAG: hypothetical protein ACJ79S_11405 [Gemmatimonadaceae bacterium]
MLSIRRHPFLLLGLLSLALFFIVEALNRAGHTNAAAAAAAPLRVLIIPMYVVWLPFTMLNVALMGPGGSPGTVARLIRICGLAAGLAPYALVDSLLVRWRRPRDHRDPAT